MSPSPAAPRIASMSAWVSTSPSECPARPRGCSNPTPASTSGTPSTSACASNPVPTRYSGTERVGELVEGPDRDRARRRLVQVTPGAAPQVNRDHAGREGGRHVVVDAVADVGDLARGPSRRGGDALEERGRGLLHPPALGRRDEVDVGPNEVLVLERHVPDGADEEAALAEPAEARLGVGVQLVVEEGATRRRDAEDVVRAPMRFPARDRRADQRHEREARDAAGVGDPLPVPTLIRERLADVEDDRTDAHPSGSWRRTRLSNTLTVLRPQLRASS